MNLKLVRLLLLSSALLVLMAGCGGDSEPPTAAPYPTYTSVPPTATPVPEATTVTPVPNIQIVNYSSFPTKEIEEWVVLAESKMESRKSRIFVVIYPIGEIKKPETRIRSDYADGYYREHEVMLSRDEIESLLNELELWLQGDTCVRDERKILTLSDYRIFFGKGADSSFHLGLCETTRTVMMAITPQMRDDEPIENVQYFLLHEFYHAFQQDLEEQGECVRKRIEAGENSNSVWMYEGGAHYFATWLVAEIYGRTNYRSEILEDAQRAFERNENWDTAPDILGASALSLMINHGMVTEESILDGSFFHNCARELEFDHTSPEIQRIKNSWHLIENSRGVFQFKEEALGN